MKKRPAPRKLELKRLTLCHLQELATVVGGESYLCTDGCDTVRTECGSCAFTECAGC